MLPRLTFLLLFLVTGGLLLRPGLGIAEGSHSTYFPLASHGIVLPDMPLLLLNPRLSTSTYNSYLEVGTPDGSQRWRLYPTPIYRTISSVSPDSRTILFTHFSDPSGTFAINPNGTQVRPVAMHGISNWSPDSTATAHQVSQTFGYDLGYTTLDGTARTVATDTHYSSFAWTPDGQALGYAANRNGAQNLYRFERAGTEETLLYAGPTDDWLLEGIPDGRWLALSRQGNDFVVTRLDADGSNPLPLFVYSYFPVGTLIDPDPTARYLFIRTLPLIYPESGFGLYTTAGDPVWTLTDYCLEFEVDDACFVQEVTWHPSGEEVIFTVQQLSYIDPKGNRSYHSRLVAMRTDGSETTPRLLDEGNFVGPANPKYSPDGRYVAYGWGVVGYSYTPDEVRVIDMDTGTRTAISEPLGIDFQGWIDPTP